MPVSLVDDAIHDGQTPVRGTRPHQRLPTYTQRIRGRMRSTTTLATSRDTVARMPIPRRYTTDAIVLSRFDLGEADRVLTLITPGIGKLKAIAKGVDRKSTRLNSSHYSPSRMPSSA